MEGIVVAAHVHRFYGEFSRVFQTYPIQFIRLDTVCVNTADTHCQQVLKLQVTVDCMGINLHIFRLESVHDRLSQAAFFNGHNANAVFGTEIRCFCIVHIGLQIQGINPLREVIDFLDPTQHFLVINLRDDAVQNFWMTNVVGNIFQILELFLDSGFVCILCICHQIHVCVSGHQIHQVYSRHRGLFINDFLILESIAVHDQIAAGLDFQTVITAVSVEVMAHHQCPVRCIDKIRLHDTVAVFPRGNKGFLGVGFDFSVIFP